MNRIAVLCGTGMSTFSKSLSSMVESRSELMFAESEWGGSSHKSRQYGQWGGFCD